MGVAGICLYHSYGMANPTIVEDIRSHGSASAARPADTARGAGRPRWRAWLFPWMSFAYLALIYGAPTGLAALLIERSAAWRFWTALLAPLGWTAVFLAVAGLLSLPHQSSIVAGKFRRDVNEPVYFHRRLYGLCWTAVYYNKPAYHLCLSLPLLKWMTFRLFGYRGSMGFTLYPDTWIRDLPLLDMDRGAYVSNRATLGTNVVLSNGFLLVDGITLRRDALIGHLAMIGPGVAVEENAEVAVGVAIGIKSKLGPGSFIGPCASIGHGVRIGPGAVIGGQSAIESRVRIGEGAAVGTSCYVAPRSFVPEHMSLPAGSVWASRMADAARPSRLGLRAEAAAGE
jgi:carbonic anhydrase/acetyltransferase-like protein (isoleucine patch superfamily)